MSKKRSLAESGLDRETSSQTQSKKRKTSHAHADSDDSKKKKKHKKSKHKSHKNHESDSDSPSDSGSKYINHAKWKYLRISQSDFYRLRTEFGDWALKRHKKYLDEIETTKCKRLFKKFIKKWNNGKLEQKYYQTFTSLSVDNHEKTRYKWSFEKNINSKEQMKLDLVRDSIDNQTNDTNLADRTAQMFQNRFEERRKKQEKRRDRNNRKERQPKDRKHRIEEKKQKRYVERQEKAKNMFASYQSFISSSNTSKKRKKK